MMFNENVKEIITRKTALLCYVMLFNANVKENVKKIVTKKTIEMFSAFILITNLGHKRILATISICAHLH